MFRYFFSVGIGNELLRVCYKFNYPINSTKLGAKGDWDFRISDLVKNPDETGI